MLKKIFKNFHLVFLVFSLLFFLFSLGFYMYNKEMAQVQYYENLASQFPPSSLQAKRYQAIAETLKQGENIYEFAASKIPALGGK